MEEQRKLRPFHLQRRDDVSNRPHPYNSPPRLPGPQSHPQALNLSTKQSGLPLKMRFKKQWNEDQAQQKQQQSFSGKIRVKNLKDLMPLPPLTAIKPIGKEPIAKNPPPAAAVTSTAGSANSTPIVTKPHQNSTPNASTTAMERTKLENVYLEILEQPISNGLRFRYQCEGRSAGSMCGASTTGRSKTYPKVKIHGYKGPAKVAVSCVEHTAPFKCHPHNLVGKNCTKGVCIVQVDQSDMTATIQSIGIQCVKKKEMSDSLKIRKANGIDPFKQGFAYNGSEFAAEGNVNPNILRLCFQAYLFPPGKKAMSLPPVVSQTIKDKKAFCDLAITDISDNWSPVEGGKKILLFSKKINRMDIEVHITYTDTQTLEQRHLKGIFSSADVHEQCGISFKTPPFPDQTITRKVEAHICLYKPSDFNQSEPISFFYYPKNDTPYSEPDLSVGEETEDSGVVADISDEADNVNKPEQDLDEDYDTFNSDVPLEIDEDPRDDEGKDDTCDNNEVAKIIIAPALPLPFKDTVNCFDIPYSILYPKPTKNLDMKSTSSESLIARDKCGKRNKKSAKMTKQKSISMESICEDMDQMDFELGLQGSE